ncbi:UNVERIFIED_CONTAM: Thylakoid membrane protein [Sesamum latifolium]|uniref:Thylakoid membrane protein n=1 Tax=Sesamum latifolium TaxID=2727402 RepID=A0AAW2X7Y4_9LAMI
MSSPAVVRGSGGGGAILLCSPTPGLSASTFKRISSPTLRLNFSTACALNNQGRFLPKTHINNGRRELRLIVGAAESTQSSSVATVTADKSLVPDEEFSLAKVSFGVIGLGVGVTLLSYGFGAYFNILPGSEWSALMLTYGFPLAIIGMALKYAELKPVPCLTYSDAQKLREKCATPILKQHLDEALKRIFQYGQGGGIPRRSAPTLQMIREEVTEDGKYCLVLVFEAKALELSDFEQRQAKFASFFGPGITAEIEREEGLGGEKGHQRRQGLEGWAADGIEDVVRGRRLVLGEWRGGGVGFPEAGVGDGVAAGDNTGASDGGRADEATGASLNQAGSLARLGFKNESNWGPLKGPKPAINNNGSILGWAFMGWSVPVLGLTRPTVHLYPHMSSH